MAFWDKLFDKREKMQYRQGCSNMFSMALVLEFRYTQEYADIDDSDYRTDLVGILATYLDTKPQEKCVRVRSTFGNDAIYYGTLNGTILINTHPIQANLKTIYLPKFQQKHSHYSKFAEEKMNNHINATTTRTLACEVLRVNGIAVDSAKINSIAVDINMILEWIDSTLSMYRFV